MLLGAAIFAAARRFEALAGKVPEGDVLVLAERQLPRLERCLAAIERLDAGLRYWPLAGLTILCLVVLLGTGFLLAS
jgi:hypothetical protein